MMEQLSYKVTPIAIVKDSRKLMDQIMQWEKAKEAKIKHHQMLLDNKKKELDVLKNMTEALEKEIVQMEGEHSKSVKDMDGALAHLLEQSRAISAAHNPPPAPTPPLLLRTSLHMLCLQNLCNLDNLSKISYIVLNRIHHRRKHNFKQFNL
eukprot:11566088-Karenia_brevis.AAC.1